MRFPSILCLYLLGQTTAAPITPASHKGSLAHADWANLDHRHLLSSSDVNNIVRAVTDADSRNPTTLLQSPFHAVGPQDPTLNCNSPICIPSSRTSRKSISQPADAGKMVTSFLYCTLMAMVGFVCLTMLLVNLYTRHDGAPCAEPDHEIDVLTTKPEPRYVAADEEVSDDFDDTDYPMG